VHTAIILKKSKEILPTMKSTYWKVLIVSGLVTVSGAQTMPTCAVSSRFVLDGRVMEI
jgi:hypothetical protein